MDEFHVVANMCRKRKEDKKSLDAARETLRTKDRLQPNDPNEKVRNKSHLAPSSLVTVDHTSHLFEHRGTTVMGHLLSFQARREARLEDVFMRFDLDESGMTHV